MAFYLGGGRAGQGEIGQLRPELDAAGVGVDIEDDEGLGLCGVCVGFGCGSVEGGGSYPSTHPCVHQNGRCVWTYVRTCGGSVTGLPSHQSSTFSGRFLHELWRLVGTGRSLFRRSCMRV